MIYTHAQDVIDIVLDLKSRYVKRDELFRKIDRMVYGQTNINIPEAYDHYALKAHSPLAMFAASTITATLCANDLKVQFAPVRQGQPGDDNATHREMWHQAAWERQEDDAQRSVHYPWIFNQVTKGLAVQKTLRRTQTTWSAYYTFSKALYKSLKQNENLTNDQKNKIYKEKTEDQKLHTAFPLITTDVPPDSFYFIRGEQGLTVAAECKYVPYSRLIAEFHDEMDKIDPRALGLGVGMGSDWQNGTGGSDLWLPTYELWDSEDVTWVIEGQGGDTAEPYIVGSRKHGLGDPESGALRGPYSIAQGIPTGSRDPALESIGALYAFMEVLPLLDAVITARGQVAFYTGWPPLERVPRSSGLIGGVSPEEIFGSTPLADEEDDEPTFEPGRVMPVGVRFAQPPRSGDELAAFQRDLMEFISPLLPASSYGDGPAESGYAQNQRIHMNMLVWNPFIKNAQNALAHRFALEDLYITQIGEPIYVERWANSIYSGQERTRYIPLGPEDVKGGSKYHVLIQPKMPSNDSLLVKQLMDEKAAGWCSDYEAEERLGKAPDEVQTQIDVERIMHSDPVLKLMDQQIMQELGIGQQEMVEEAMRRAAQLAAAGYNSPSGGPMPIAGANSPAGAGTSGLPTTGGGAVAPGQGMPLLPGPGTAGDGIPGGARPNPVGTPSGGQAIPAGAQPVPGMGG